MDNVRTGMLSISLAKHCPNTYFGQGSYNMQAFSKNSSTSKSKRRSETSGEGRSDDLGILHSGTSHEGDPQFVYVPNEHGRIIAQRVTMPVLTLPSRLEIPSTRSKRLSRCPSALPTSASSRSRTRAPARPPPPPEELRPDLSLFMAPIGSRSVVRSGIGDDEKLHAENVWSRECGSEESVGSRKGIITKTQGWDVRFDDYHKF
jgi:hypothetical protein